MLLEALLTFPEDVKTQYLVIFSLSFFPNSISDLGTLDIIHNDMTSMDTHFIETWYKNKSYIKFCLLIVASYPK